MNDFDRQLETELALMLDRVVRAPAPLRRGRPRLRPIVALHTTPAAEAAPAAQIDHAAPALLM